MVKQRLSIVEKMYGISLCFLDTALVPIIFDDHIKDKEHFALIQSSYKMPNGKIDRNSISSYAV